MLRLESQLLQLRVFGPGLPQDGDFGVGIFPQCEEVLVASAGFDCVALQRVCAGKIEICQRADGFIPHHPAIVENFPELGRSFASLMSGQICFGFCGLGGINSADSHSTSETPNREAPSHEKKVRGG
jgi:hypothetical protein